MSTEDKLEGARNGLAFSFAYMNMAGQEIGMERAIALSARAYEAMGNEQGKRMKEQMGGNNIDINTAATMATDLIKDAFGISSVIVKSSPDKIKVSCSRCPVYEAAQSVGIDTETIETLCRTGSTKFMDSLVKQLNPNLSYRLTKFRSGPDESCQEEIVMV